ncbi:MAG: hypothetical protein ABEK03_05730 [Candidatus Bipolaricaulia bacterium]
MNPQRLRMISLSGILVVALLGLGPSASALSDGPIEISSVDAERHFRAVVQTPSTDVVDVIETAQQQGYWIRIQTDQDVTYLHGSEPCSSCDPGQESQFFEPPQLIVDGQRFWIRLDESQWRVNLRPAPQTSGYEFIVSPKLPKTSLSSDDLDRILEALAPFGVVPTQSASLQLEPMTQPRKPVPPDEAQIDSVLYGLTQAPDWMDYAERQNISLSGLRAEVIVELTSAEASLPDGIDLVATSRNGALISAQARIDQLVRLASAPSVAFVRPPSRPQPAAQ